MSLRYVFTEEVIFAFLIALLVLLLFRREGCITVSAVLLGLCRVVLIVVRIMSGCSDLLELCRVVLIVVRIMYSSDC